MSTATRSRITQGRDKLLAAAKDLLWERGYEDMSPRDIMARSGAGQGSLYHHFESKQGLARAALDEMVAEETAAMEAIFAPDTAPVQRLDAYLTRQREALRGCRIGRLANEAAMSDPTLREPVAAYLGHVEALIRRALEDGIADGSLKPSVDAGALAATFLSIIEGGFILARAHWDAARMEQALKGGEAVLDMIATQARRKAPTAEPIASPGPTASVPWEAPETADGSFY